ncbi:RCC1 domain-containing protein [Polyangium sp. 6x1]|uniref:RCC1 domain-containing protein n=1 Tax=Polyangium sp. 6x1 TaxID=3042689 RepID=UPI00248283D0|nr:RCC1 domain-containing protein [Polyangium sp. 6x1]MDI1446808.1 hypothetical protein [Polyangium sp. 6x1]
MKRFGSFACLAAPLFVACAGPVDSVPLSGDPPPPTPATEEFFFPAPMTQIAAAEVASFVVLADGTVWGFSNVPQPSIVPEKNAPFYGVQDRTPRRIEGLDDVVSVAFRFRHGCALHRDGTVSCWGDNRNGQLGIGSRTSTRVPTKIGGLEHVVEVDVGEWHSCARLEGGRVTCWGERTAYFPTNPLKDGSVLDLTPFELEILPPMGGLALSRLHTCGTTTAGEVRCWGNLWPEDSSVGISLDEQLAYRDFRLTAAPARLLHGSCVLQVGGTLACACQNEEVSLSDEKLPCYGQEEAVSSFGADIVDADMQMAQACAIFGDGAVRCKGGFRSTFGDVTPWMYEAWEPIEGLVSPSAVAVGVDACVIDGDCLKCFGPWIGREPRKIGCYVPPPEEPH